MITAKLEGQRLIVEFDPRTGEGLGALFETIARIKGDYSETLAACNEIHVQFHRPDDAGKVYAWMQGAMQNHKIVTVRPVNVAADEALKKEEAAGRKAWTNLLPAESKRKSLMRPTTRIQKMPG